MKSGIIPFSGKKSFGEWKPGTMDLSAERRRGRDENLLLFSNWGFRFDYGSFTSEREKFNDLAKITIWIQ